MSHSIRQNSAATQDRPSRTLVLLAFLAIYVIWGSTYLAIRVAVVTMPPFLMAAVRFLIAGGLLLALLRLRGVPFPTAAQWRNACVAGVLLFVGGNGLVVWAARSVPSGVIALIVATTPIWIALIDWARPGGLAPGLKNSLGILLGLSGVAFLFMGHAGPAEGASLHLAGVAAVLLASIAWASGSLYLRSTERPASGWMGIAAQMVSGGAALLLIAMACGEPAHVNWSAISTRSMVAFLYLMIIGSWVGFGAYTWLLQVSTPTRVATYAYVNPVVAVFLGWAFAGEAVTSRTLVSALVTLLGVVLIVIPAGSFRTLYGLVSRKNC